MIIFVCGDQTPIVQSEYIGKMNSKCGKHREDQKAKGLKKIIKILIRLKGLANSLDHTKIHRNEESEYKIENRKSRIYRIRAV